MTEILLILCDMWKSYGIQISVSINKAFIGTQPRPLTFLLAMCASVLRQNWETVTELAYPTKPRIFLLWLDQVRSNSGLCIGKWPSSQAEIFTIQLLTWKQDRFWLSVGCGHGNFMEIQRSRFHSPFITSLWERLIGCSSSQPQSPQHQNEHNTMTYS